MPAEVVFAVASVGVACVAIALGRRLRAEAPGAALGVDAPPGDADHHRAFPGRAEAALGEEGEEGPDQGEVTTNDPAWPPRVV